jgi:hypothetical protein
MMAWARYGTTRLWVGVALGLCLAVAIALPVAATDNTTLQLRIVPLECSIDTLTTGPNSLTQVSPEECGEHPPVVSPPSVRPFSPVPGSANPRYSFRPFAEYPLATGYDSVRPLPIAPHEPSNPDVNPARPPIVGDVVIPSLLVAFLVAILLAPPLMRGARQLVRAIACRISSKKHGQ